MATLKLDKKKPAAAGKTAAAAPRAPLRGKGLSRPRQTLAQAQAERTERQQQRDAQREAQERERGGFDARGPGRGTAKPAAKRAGTGPGKPTSSFKTEGPGPARRADPGARSGKAGAFQTGEAYARPAGPKRAPARPASPQPRFERAPARRDDLPYADAPRPPRPAPTPRTNPTEGERLSKRMSDLGLASRREADDWIAAGWVRVDGRVAEIGERVGPAARIEVDPAARHEQAQRVTILINKPIGYVSGQAEDGYEPAAALIKAATRWKDDPAETRFNPAQLRGLAPAGRLDIDSTGLLVLTQDGRIAKALIGDDSRVEKEYLVRVEYLGQAGHPMEHLPAESLALLNHGLELDGVTLKPAKVSWQNEDQLRFVLREGRKRQIRRMCELVGLKVVGLKRVRIGRVNLGHLPLGQWRYLAPWERFD
ncbi:MAG: rRNA pseudouridine synthase [Pelomonas sp.]|nr:rRNA pseudouridine synthase [Roseateles sp.]